MAKDHICAILCTLAIGSLTHCTTPANGSDDASLDADALDARTSDRGDLGLVLDSAPTVDTSLNIDSEIAAQDRVDPVDVVPPIDDEVGWRSELFPQRWVPLHAGGRATADGRFLHDFSFAGYHRGDDSPPVGRGAATRTVNAMTFGNGRDDATAAIQQAIDETCVAGGGVVALSAGLFRLRFASATAALRISCSNIVLRGQSATGPNATQLFLDDPTNARSRAMILVAPLTSSLTTGDRLRPERRITRDLTTPTRTIEVELTDGFAVGDAVTIRSDITAAFRAAHHMDAAHTNEGDYWPVNSTSGVYLYRTVVAVSSANRTLTLDGPTRYPMLQRDQTRVFEPSGYLSEVGIESLAIGMREHMTSAMGNPGPLGDLADDAYNTRGTAAYDVHASSAILLTGVRNSWLSDVESFQPSTNALSRAHLLSIGINITDQSHHITVQRCHLQSPQYRGGGGNGYLYFVEGADNLLQNNVGTMGRHSFLLSGFTCNGNVLRQCTVENDRYADDSHRFLSHANLFDQMRLNQAWVQSVNRGTTSDGAGYTATQSLWWNTHVIANHPTTLAVMGHPRGFAVETAQYGWGYVIGTSANAGASAEVVTSTMTNDYWAMREQGAPTDHVEGVGRGATLVPASLYLEQMQLRRARGGY